MNVWQKVLVILVVFAIIGAVSGNAFAYGDDAPSTNIVGGSCYIEMQTSQLGRITVYFPVTYQDSYFSIRSDGQLVNITNSTLTGYFRYGSSEYTFRCTTFSTPQYRLTNGSGSYVNLTVNGVYNSNMTLLESFPTQFSFHTSSFDLIELFLMGVCVLCLFMKRS